MTNEEAIKIIGQIKPNDKLDSMKRVEALMAAMTALEKSIPAPEGKNRMLHICPTCGTKFKLHVNFCDNCGQALKDWSEK